MQETEHYKLKKPSAEDFYNIADQSGNMDKLDAALHGLEEGKADLDPVTGKVRGDQLPDMPYVPNSRKVNGKALNADINLTAPDVGAISTAQKGAAGGVAELGSDGLLKEGQRPLSLALGETSSTAYRGDRGKTAYDHSQTGGNPHGTTAVQVGADPAGAAAAVQGALSTHAADQVTHITGAERAAWNAKRPNIIRTHPIAPSNTVSAGDVVDVVGGGALKKIEAQPNVKYALNPASSQGTATCDLSANYALIATASSSKLNVFLVDKKTGKSIGIGVASDVATSLLNLARLTDTTFVIGFIANDNLRASIGTVENNTITFGSLGVVSSITTNHNAILPLSESSFVYVYNRIGLKARVCTVSGTGIALGTEYALSTNNAAEWISATRLPDDGGDRRICICYSQSTDNAKGKAVIATINSSNTVSFGSAVLFEDYSGGTAYTSCCADGNDAIVFYSATGNNGHVKVLSVAGTVITPNSAVSVSPSLTNNNKILKIDDNKFFCAHNQSGSGGTAGRSFLVLRSGNTLTKSTEYTFNSAGQSTYISMDTIDDEQMLLAFVDNSNTSYPTSTVLSIRGNVIAGVFANVSSQAIALQSGTEGQSIDIIYDGVAELSGITAGTQITSPGVQGYAPQDGWLWVRPEWEQTITAQQALLKDIVVSSAAATVNVPLDDIDIKLYRKLEIEIDFLGNIGFADLSIRFNNKATSGDYRVAFWAAAASAVNNATAYISPASGAYEKIFMSINCLNGRFFGQGQVLSANNTSGWMSSMVSVVDVLTVMNVVFSAGTIPVGTTIKIYGVRK